MFGVLLDWIAFIVCCISFSLFENHSYYCFCQVIHCLHNPMLLLRIFGLGLVFSSSDSICFALSWCGCQKLTGFAGQLVMDILTVVAGKTDCKTSNNTPCTNSSSSENILIWIRTTCLSEDTIYPNFWKSWWNGKGRDILCLEETKMGEQLQHSSKWTHYISCQAKSFLLSQTE